MQNRNLRQFITPICQTLRQPGSQFISTPAPIIHFNMYRSIALATALLAAAAHGQQVGTQQTETHPGMTWQTCTAPGKCTTKNGKVVIDSNWRWLHDKTSGSYTKCYTGNTWNTTLFAYISLRPCSFLKYLGGNL